MPRPGASRVEVDHPRPLLDGGLVRVPRDHDPHANRDGVDVQVRDVMDHVEEHPAQLHQRGPGDALRPGAKVVVAAHGGQWRDRAQCIEYGGFADVARMDEVVAAVQVRPCFRAEQIVGVRDHADAQHGCETVLFARLRCSGLNRRA